MGLVTLPIPSDLRSRIRVGSESDRIGSGFCCAVDMTTPAAPPPDASAPTSNPPAIQDAPGWRLVFLFTTNALEGSWAKFVRVLVLLLVLTAALGAMIHFLGPYAAGGLGLGTVGAAALSRGSTSKRGRRS